VYSLLEEVYRSGSCGPLRAYFRTFKAIKNGAKHNAKINHRVIFRFVLQVGP
jgi:hypothetical protein